jgi:hypothetical protein
MNCDLLKVSEMHLSTISGLYTNRITPQGKNNVIIYNYKSSQQLLGFLQECEQLCIGISDRNFLFH